MAARLIKLWQTLLKQTVQRQIRRKEIKPELIMKNEYQDKIYLQFSYVKLLMKL